MAEDIERAIAAFQEALSGLKRETDPAAWAAASVRLGREYLRRIRGARSDNLEQAIGYFRAALDIIVRAEYPREWASVSGDLGLALALRVSGDRKSNLEESVKLYLGILEIIDREAMPEEWARTLVLLGRAYSELAGTTPELLIGEFAREFAARPQAPVFISYAHEDFSAAERLFAILAQSGLQPWLDKKSILPGQRWKMAINTAIEESRFF